MKRILLVAALSSLSAAVLLLAAAADPIATPAAAPAVARGLADEHAGNEVLEAYMEDFQRSLRRLQKKLADAEARAEVIAEVCRLQKVAIDAKSELPVLIAEQAEEQQPAERVAYRKQMQQVVRTLLDLEDALLDDDPEAAMDQLRKLNEAKQSGHERFKGDS